MPKSWSPPARAHYNGAIARIPPSQRPPTSLSEPTHCIPPAETTLSPAFRSCNPRAATRPPHAHAHARQTNPDVAARPPPPPLPTPPPPLPLAPPRCNPPAQTLDCEPCSCTALPTVDKVDSKQKTTAATVRSRAHSRLASFGRIRSRGAQQPADRIYTAVEPLPTHPEPPAHRPTPSLASSHKRSEPSTASFYSSETTLSDEKYQDTKSFEEPRQSLARSSQRNPSSERKKISEDSTCDPAEQYNRLVESRARMMHQTSSRLLRMTEDDRPYTRVSIIFFVHVHPSVPVLRFPL